MAGTRVLGVMCETMSNDQLREAALRLRAIADDTPDQLGSRFYAQSADALERLATDREAEDG